MLSLCLFVAGDSPDSQVAIANLRTLFATPDDTVEIEVIDVQRDPGRAAKSAILVTPTLLKLAPAPPLRILGNLKNRSALQRLLGLEPTDAGVDPEVEPNGSR